MALCDLSMKELRSLIDRQLAAKAKALADAKELEDLLTESLAEFMRRVAPPRSDQGSDKP